MSHLLGQRAVVIGAGIGGLSAAGALAGYFGQVDVLERDGWLGPKGTTVRGYRSGRWWLQTAPEPDHCPGSSGPLTREADACVVGAVASACSSVCRVGKCR